MKTCGGNTTTDDVGTDASFEASVESGELRRALAGVRRGPLRLLSSLPRRAPAMTITVAGRGGTSFAAPGFAPSVPSRVRGISIAPPAFAFADASAAISATRVGLPKIMKTAYHLRAITAPGGARDDWMGVLVDDVG